MIPRRIDADSLIMQSIQPSDKNIIKKGIRDQLRKGMVDPNLDSERQRSYSPSYKKYRSKRGRQTDFVDLRLTSQLYNGITVHLAGFSLKTDNSSNSYAQLISTFDWAKHSMDVSRETMGKFVNSIEMKVLKKII